MINGGNISVMVGFKDHETHFFPHLPDATEVEEVARLIKTRKGLPADDADVFFGYMRRLPSGRDKVELIPDSDTLAEVYKNIIKDTPSTHQSLMNLVSLFGCIRQGREKIHSRGS